MIMMFSRTSLAASVALAAMATGIAYAATQGTVGSTSTGTAKINASKGNSVQISALADVTFPPSLTTPAPISQTACVFSSTGNYTIQATSSYPSGGTFRMNDGGSAGTDFVNYSVGWYNVTAGGIPVTLSSGTASGTITGANTTSTSCGGGTNSRFEITVDNTTFTAANSSTFTDTLTLLVAPI